MQIQAASFSFDIVRHYSLINCSFCRSLRSVENFWDSFNPSSVSLIALDAHAAPFGSPLEQYFVWCGFKEAQHTDTRTLLHIQSEKGSENTQINEHMQNGQKCI